jgi:maleylpyruvate isomerase
VSRRGLAKRERLLDSTSSMPSQRVYLYLRQASPGCLAVRIGLELKDLQWREAEVPASGPEHDAYLLMSPTGVLPCLEIEGIVVAGTVATLEYLDESHPGPPLMPRDPYLRAHVRQTMYAIAEVLAPLDASGCDAGVEQIADFEEALVSIDRLIEREAGNYSAGRSMSLADPMVHALAECARVAGIDIAPFASISTVVKHLSRLPGFGRARI